MSILTEFLYLEGPYIDSCAGEFGFPGGETYGRIHE